MDIIGDILHNTGERDLCRQMGSTVETDDQSGLVLVCKEGS